MRAIESNIACEEVFPLGPPRELDRRRISHQTCPNRELLGVRAIRIRNLHLIHAFVRGELEYALHGPRPSIATVNVKANETRRPEREALLGPAPGAWGRNPPAPTCRNEWPIRRQSF